MGGGAWPFVVRGAICLINFDNERDSGLLNSLKFEGTFSRLLSRINGTLQAIRNGAITGL